MDEKSCVDLLVEGGTSKKDAVSKVRKTFETMQESGKFNDINDDKAYELIYYTIKEVNKVSGEKFIGVCVGFANRVEKKQSREYRKAALDAYKSNPEIAKAEDIVRVRVDKREFIDDEHKIKNENYGKPIKINGNEVVDVVDKREFIDQACKIKNFNYNEKFKPDYMRYMYFANSETKELKTVVGNHLPEIGAEYTVYSTNVSGDTIFTNKFGITKRHTLSANEFWDFVNEVVINLPDGVAVSLGDIKFLETYKFVVTIGTVSATPMTTSQNRFLVVNDETLPDGLGIFTRFNPELKDYVEDIEKGTEVIIFGNISSSEGYDNTISPVSVIPNPSTENYKEKMSDIMALISE